MNKTLPFLLEKHNFWGGSDLNGCLGIFYEASFECLLVNISIDEYFQNGLLFSDF